MPIPVSANFLKRAKQPSQVRNSVVSVEDLDPQIVTYGSQADWAGSTTLTNISTTRQPGDAYPLSEGSTAATLTREGPLPVSGRLGIRYNFSPESFDSFLEQMTHGGVSFNDFEGATIPPSQDAMKVRITIRSGSHAGSTLYQGSYVGKTFTSSFVSGTVGGNDLVYKWTMPGSFSDAISPGIDITGGVNIYVTIDIDDAEGRNMTTGGLTATTRTYEDLPQGSANCSLRTSTMDMGSVPTSDPIFGVIDTEGSGSSLVYTIYGDNFSPPTTSRGAFVDGDPVPAFQYYEAEADFTASVASQRAILAQLEFAVTQSFFIANRDVPEIGIVKPLIVPGGIKQISTRIDRERPTNIGETTVRMAWTRWLGDLVATEFLKGKSIGIDAGFPSLSLEEYAPIFRGTIYDYTANHFEGWIDLILRDVLERFRKVKLPKETTDGAGNKTTANLIFPAGTNILQAMLTIFNQMEIPGRMIATDEFEALRDGLYNHPIYDIERTVYASSPEAAFTLLNELSVLSGIFLVPYADGKIYPIPYDPNTVTSGVLDGRFGDFKLIKGGLKDLYSRELIYYNVSAGVTNPGDNEDDYDNLDILIDNDTEALYTDYQEKRWFDKWSGSTALINALAHRRDSWWARPKRLYRAENFPIRHISTQPGDIVPLANIHLPVPEADWPGTTSVGNALILSWNPDFIKGTISFDMVEVEVPTLYFPDSFVAIKGTDVGSIDNVQEVDEVYFQIDEAGGGSGGFEYTFDIIVTGPEDIHQAVFYGYYTGNHNVKISAYEFGATSPDYVNLTGDTDDFPNASSDYFRAFDFDFTDNFYSLNTDGSRTMRFKILHSTPGIASHDFFIDLFGVRGR